MHPSLRSVQAKLKSLSGGKIYVAGPSNVLGKFCPTFSDYEVLRASSGQSAVVCRQISAGFGHQVAVSSEGEVRVFVFMFVCVVVICNEIKNKKH